MPKQKPKYKAQQQFENQFKLNYNNMITNCCKTILVVLNKIQKCDTK